MWFSYYLRLGSLAPISEKGFEALILSLIISIPIFSIFGLHRAIFRFSGPYTLLVISRAIFIYGVFYSLLISFIGIEGVPRTIGLIQPIILFIVICIWRLFLRFILRRIISNTSKYKKPARVFVYGAGSAGRQLVRAMQDSSEMSIKGFIDDDISQQGCFIDGKPIYSPKELREIIVKRNISLILLALPSVSRSRRNEIIKNLNKLKVAVRSIPGISDIANGKSLITDFEDLGIDDLLGRGEVEPFENLMKKNIYLQNILVTGAGGSIGSELCRQIVKLRPKVLLLVEISEFALYSIQSQLAELVDSDVEVIPLIASIKDINRMREIIKIWKPSTIYHAAAYKHVPIVEHNLLEGINNNASGTLEFAKISLSNNVSNFVFISTDKAVRPTNVMGATKRLAELCLQGLNQEIANKDINGPKTKFSIVRFGNVLDSSGSVIPKFRSQIKNREAITLTHKDITRYFMTITEAAQLVIQAGAMGKGGDVFVLDMGKPIKIYDLALKMIQLSGLALKSKDNQKGDIEIKVTGLRPGEKLYEELLLSKDPIKTKHPKIFRSEEPFIPFEELQNEINNLKSMILKNDLENIFIKLKKIVIDYSPNSGLIDHTFQKRNNFLM